MEDLNAFKNSLKERKKMLVNKGLNVVAIP